MKELRLKGKDFKLAPCWKESLELWEEFRRNDTSTILSDEYFSHRSAFVRTVAFQETFLQPTGMSQLLQHTVGTLNGFAVPRVKMTREFAFDVFEINRGGQVLTQTHHVGRHGMLSSSIGSVGGDSLFSFVRTLSKSTPY